MSDIFNLLIDSDLTTKLFVLISVIILSLVQFILFRLPFKIITILALHNLFGVILARVTSYNLLVHLVLYIIPSILISGVLTLIFPRKKKPNGKRDPMICHLRQTKETLS